MRIGIDLGGTKTEGVALDREGTVVARVREATPADDYDAILGGIQTIVTRLEREVGEQCSVGIGMPGAISTHSGLVKNANTVVLNDRDIVGDLSSLMGRELRFANDANCLALSEAVDGAGQGYRVVFAVIIGTGCGGGLVVDGKLLVGANAIGGEWGHNSLPWPSAEEFPGPDCYCGKRGCIETYLSGAGLVRAYQQSSGQKSGGRDEKSAANIATASLNGDARAASAIRLYSDRLARSLASVINISDPDVVVLGGGLSKIERLYSDLPELLTRYVFSDVIATKILPATHGDSSGVRGAAWLWGEDSS